MNTYNETTQAELTGVIQSDGRDEWIGYGDLDGVRVRCVYYTETDQTTSQLDDIDFEDALEIVQEINEELDVVKTLWEK